MLGRPPSSQAAADNVLDGVQAAVQGTVAPTAGWLAARLRVEAYEVLCVAAARQAPQAVRLLRRRQGGTVLERIDAKGAPLWPEPAEDVQLRDAWQRRVAEYAHHLRRLGREPFVSLPLA